MMSKSCGRDSEAARFMRAASAQPLYACAIAAQDMIAADHGEAVSDADRPMDGSAISALRGFKSALRGLLAGLCDDIQQRCSQLSLCFIYGRCTALSDAHLVPGPRTHTPRRLVRAPRPVALRSPERSPSI